MIHIRRIAVLATATTVAVVGGAIALLLMMLVVLSAIFGRGAAMFMPLGGGLALLIAPLLYGAFLWLITAVVCAVYNVVATYTGGIGFRVEREDGPTAPARTEESPTASR